MIRLGLSSITVIDMILLTPLLPIVRFRFGALGSHEKINIFVSHDDWLIFWASRWLLKDGILS